ncbi:MAG: dephospho-CoA kinase [Clostridia bacterium]|jgi:dephospho-CoA kinase|nr:dephospho-CoA kinase [Clostridia bacterium]
MPRIIGLTGGIASGKSLISGKLKEWGAMIIDADEIARALTGPDSPALREIRRSFGDEVFNADGTLSRKKLGTMVFNSVEARNRLNGLLHPLVQTEIKRQLAENKEKDWPLLVIDAPLLLEAGLEKMTDEVWVVALDEQEQVRRLMARDALTREEASRRLAAQMPLKEKLQYADRIIDNNGSMEETLEILKNLWLEVVNQAG